MGSLQIVAICICVTAAIMAILLLILCNVYAVVSAYENIHGLSVQLLFVTINCLFVAGLFVPSTMILYLTPDMNFSDLTCRFSKLSVICIMSLYRSRLLF